MAKFYAIVVKDAEELSNCATASQFLDALHLDVTPYEIETCVEIIEPGPDRQITVVGGPR